MLTSQESYIEAAIRVIVRYGVRRTTMHDIAVEAGVSRQTLYAAFDNKESVLRAAVRLVGDRSLRVIARECVPRPLAQQLDIVFEELALAPYRLVHAAPDAADLVEGLTAACADEVQDVGKRFRIAIAQLLAPHAASLERAGLDAEAVADLLQTSLHAFKSVARDEAHLCALWATLRTMMKRAAGESPTSLTA